MSDLAIRMEGLGKRYHIDGDSAAYRTFRDTLAHAVRRPVRAAKSLIGRKERKGKETIWALRDISLEVRPGEVMGIIGRNGAGKSTLLKILSRITEPTEGQAELSGRVGSLLEVGTGFHPELTGAENIYMNGAILGMKKQEIRRKFDEIVAFAEVERFVNTPVKRYSTGMFLRLAFAVAAHLELETLLIDEVLAVGDAAFQKKCVGKMGEVARQGRTVLFVSHNLAHVRRLCETALWLEGGKVLGYGPIEVVAARYQQRVANLGARPLSERAAAADGDGFLSWRLIGNSSDIVSDPHVLVRDEPFTMEILLRLDRAILNGHHGLVLQSAEDGRRVGGWGINGISLKPGVHRLIYELPHLPVRPGVYTWYASLWDGPTRLDIGELYPDLVVATQDHSGLDPEWAGVINVPWRVSTETVEEGFIDAH
jgi:ABC-type polysaccharide/polyol phosphate transport system ATPase subunit